LTKLAPALREIFASDESEFAKLFAGYMKAPPAANSKSSPVSEPARPANGETKK
jgi:hypothetical protein